MPTGGQVDIPGWNDVIHIIPPPLLDPELQKLKKRAQYLAIRNSTNPEIVKRANQWINTLDDAEDILSTALVLGKPLLRRLPSRLVPGIGWILLGGDIIDMATWALSLTSTGLLQKRNVGEQVRSLSFRRGNRVRKIERFMNTAPGLGALIEGLQVTDQFFGVGLSLGPLMGLGSEVVWGSLRSLAGERVKLKPPPRITLEERAALLTWQTPPILARSFFLPEDMTQTLFAAVQFAFDILKGTSDLLREAGRFSLIRNEPVPQFLPSNELTRQIIKDFGVDPDRDEPPMPVTFNPRVTSINDWVTLTAQDAPNAAIQYRNKSGKGLKATWLTMGALEITDSAITWAAEEEKDDVWTPNGADMSLKTMVEYGYTFWPDTPKQTKAAILSETMSSAHQRTHGVAVPPNEARILLTGDLQTSTVPKPLPFEIEAALLKHGGHTLGIPRLPPFEQPNHWTLPEPTPDPRITEFLETP